MINHILVTGEQLAAFVERETGAIVEELPAITTGFIIGAHAYCTIRRGFRSLDVLLSPGKGPKASMLESAAEMQEKADYYASTAKLIADAAHTL